MNTNQLRINLSTGLLLPVNFCASAHFNERPAETAIDMIVVHNISLPPGEFGGNAIERFFCGKLNAAEHPYFSDIAGMRVAAHLLIKRSGEIIQFVPFHLRAWHAGESSFQGRLGCNDFSIGIELEGTDTIPYEATQYQQLANVSRILMAAYPAITPERIVGHSDIAPTRKTDPGAIFDWNLFKGMLA